MDRQHAHQLLDQLDPGQLAAIGHLLEVMLDPVARAAAAALPDDEPVTEEDRRRLRDGMVCFADRGKEGGVSMEEVLAQTGVAQENLG